MTLRCGCLPVPSPPAAACASASAAACRSASRARARRTRAVSCGSAGRRPSRDPAVPAARTASQPATAACCSATSLSSRSCCAASATAAGPAVRGAGRHRLQVGLPLLPGGGLGGFPLAFQLLQAGQRPPGPRPRIRQARHRVPAQQQVRAGQHRVAPLVVADGLPGVSHHLAGELVQPGLGPGGLLRGVRGDLDPIAGHHAQPPQPSLRAYVKNLVKQVFRQARLGEQVLAEPGERRVVRDRPAARDPERRIVAAPVLHRPAGQHPAQVGVHPDRQQHHRVIPGRAGRRALRGRRHQPDGEVPRHEPLDRADHDPDSMALRHPVEHVMGQKHPGFTVNRFELVCHKPILPATTPTIRKT